MSRHPGNPYWDQQRDEAIVIYRQDWDDALENGWVTTEHIVHRLAGMVNHGLGQQLDGPAAYDEHGFISALIAAGLSMRNGVRAHIYPDDHNPPHAHLEVPGLENAKLTINLETLKIDQELPSGWSKRGKKVESEVRSHQQELLDMWRSYRESLGNE